MGKRQTRIKARELWRQGWTIEDIANELYVRPRTLRVWVRDVILTPEEEIKIAEKNPQWLESYRRGQHLKLLALKTRIQNQNLGRKKAQEESVLHMMGAMLYWGEGSKSRNVMSFINTDPYMLKLFIRFLREEMNIENNLINIRIIHHTTDEEEIKRIKQYWLDWLELPPTTNVSTQLKIGTTSRKKRYANGMCTIIVNRTEIVQHIFGAIQEYVGIDKPEWGK